MKHSALAVIGVGNMAKAIISGVVSASLPVSDIILYDKNKQQYENLPEFERYAYAETISAAIQSSDYVLLAVKPQNYAEILAEISQVPEHRNKVYISIAAGISSDYVSAFLHHACVIRVLPNVPMLIGKGVSLICENKNTSSQAFSFVCELFCAAGSILLIQESDMNAMIGVTSSSPAYVFRFIQAIYQGARAQGVPEQNLLSAICDMVIGSALMLKTSADTPEQLIAKVASKGGTTEKALEQLTAGQFDQLIEKAMIACTKRADELGAPPQSV